MQVLTEAADNTAVGSHLHTEVTEEPVSAEQILEGVSTHTGEPIRILVADDNVVSRRPIEVVLNRWGYEVVTASSGTEAWDLLSGQNAPRIAILDWMMPGLSGPEVCQLVRNQQRE